MVRKNTRRPASRRLCATTAPASSPPAASAADPNGSAYLAAGSGDSVAEYVDAVVTDLGGSWSAWFHANGRAEPKVGIVTIDAGRNYVSTCSHTVLTSDTPNATFSCRGDDAPTRRGAALGQGR